MTIAELILFIAVAFGIYKLFRPIQKRLEKLFFRFISGGRKGARPIIDVTDYSSRFKKKDKYEN